MLSLSSIKAAIGIDNENDSNINKASENLFQSFESLPTFKQAEQLLLQDALRRTHGNKTLAAQMMGLSPSALSQRLSKLKL